MAKKRRMAEKEMTEALWLAKGIPSAPEPLLWMADVCCGIQDNREAYFSRLRRRLVVFAEKKAAAAWQGHRPRYRLSNVQNLNLTLLVHLGAIVGSRFSHDLQAKLDSANERYEAILRDEQARATFLLATMIIDDTDPGKSVAELEKLGEEKLRMIVTWLRTGKDHEQTETETT